MSNTEELQTSIQLLSSLLEDISTPAADALDMSVSAAESQDVSEADTVSEDRLRMYLCLYICHKG